MTPFEVMFGRELVTRIDLLFPNRLEITGENIRQNETVQIAALGECIIGEFIEQVDELRDVEPP